MVAIDVTKGAEGILPAGGGTSGRIPQFDSTGNAFEDSAIVEETDRIRFDKKGEFPAGSIIIGQSVELSEGTANLVVVDLLKNTMAFAAGVGFDPTLGSSDPSFPDFGAQFVLNIQTDDTQILTANPLTFQLTGTVTAPSIRVVDTFTIRTNGAMTNFKAQITDNATGTVLRYIPSQAAFEGLVPGLTLISGDNTFVLTSNTADTSGVFNLGFVPFIIEAGQVVDFEFTADSINLKGDISGIPFILADVHDGPPASVLTPKALTRGIAINNVAHTPNLVEGIAETLSRVDVYLKTGITNTATAKQFTAGDTTGPNLILDGSPVFASGDFVLVEGDAENDGLFEVFSNIGTLLEFKGVGGAANVEDFTRDQVITKIGTVTVTNVNVSVRRTSLTGTIEHGQASFTPIPFFELANLVDVPTLETEEFANTDARFFGELGVPNDQAGWSDVATAPATITVDTTQQVFGINRDVIKHFDDGSGATNSTFALFGQNWLDINAFGASYGGISRLDTLDGDSGFFSGLQANAAENPLATGSRRYGFQFSNSGGFLQVLRVEGGSVLLDGTSGNPKVLFDEWFKWECVVPPGLGAAQFFINGILTTLAPLFAVNVGGQGTHAIVSSGSSSGTNRIAYHDNFGVTVYEEGTTKTFSSASMQSATARILIPPGRRDYTVIVPDGNPRNLGDVLAFTLQNVGGKLTLKTQNVSVPQSLFTGLNELVKVTDEIESIALINTVANSNIYEFSIPPIQADELTPSYVSTADATVANTTVATTIIGTGEGSLTVAANSVAAGDCFQFRAGGIFSAGANPTLRLKLKFGTLTVGDTGVVVISNVTDGHWVLEGTATVRSIGATGTISVEGGFTTSAGDHFAFVFLVPTIVDTTQNNEADMTAQWGTASAGNTITAQNVSIIKVLSP